MRGKIKFLENLAGTSQTYVSDLLYDFLERKQKMILIWASTEISKSIC